MPRKQCLLHLITPRAVGPVDSARCSSHFFVCKEFSLSRKNLPKKRLFEVFHSKKFAAFSNVMSYQIVAQSSLPKNAMARWVVSDKNAFCIKNSCRQNSTLWDTPHFGPTESVELIALTSKEFSFASNFLVDFFFGGHRNRHRSTPAQVLESVRVLESGGPMFPHS